MTKEEKAVDIWKRVATLNKIPEGFRFNKDRVWAKLESRLDEHRVTKFARRVLIAAIVIIVVAVAFAIGARMNNKRINPKQKQSQQPSAFINSSNQNQLI